MGLETLLGIYEILSNPIALIIIVIAIIVVIREVVLWYFRIHAIVNRQDKQIALLEALIEVISQKK